MQADPLEKTLSWERLKGKGEGRGSGWLDSITDSMNMNLSKLQEIVEYRGVWCAVAHRVTKRLDLATEKTQFKVISTAASRVEAQVRA